MTEETIEAWTERKIAEHRKEHGENWGHYFFNNFDGNLPGGYRVKKSPDPLCERIRVGMLDENHSENQPGAGQRISNQTLREFYEECESAAIEAGITPEEIIEARERFKLPVISFGRVVPEMFYPSEEFYKMIAPIYLILRKRGYNHYPDLTA